MCLKCSIKITLLKYILYKKILPRTLPLKNIIDCNILGQKAKLLHLVICTKRKLLPGILTLCIVYAGLKITLLKFILYKKILPRTLPLKNIIDCNILGQKAKLLHLVICTKRKPLRIPQPPSYNLLK